MQTRQMRSFWSRGLDRQRLILAAGLALVLVFGLWGWGLATRVQGAEQKTPAHQGAGTVTVKTAQATEGGIASSLSYTGDVKAVSQISVLPKATGRIERMLVDVGSRVKKGDTIAELDSASLKAQVTQAKANLASAQARLANMESGSRAEQVAQAKAALDAAQANADKVRKGATENDLQMAQADVDAAKAALVRVKQGPTQTQWWQALGALDAARANMKAAEARLADVKAGPKPADIAAAEAAVEAARAALYAADDVKSFAGDNNSLASLAPLGVTSAGQAGRNADAALANYNAAVEKLNLLKSYPLPADLQAAQSAFDAAKAAYEQWSNAVDEMKRGPKPEDIQQAEAALAKAEARLKQLKGGPTEEDLKAIDAAVEQAQQAYNLALRPYTQHDIEMARAGVTQAQAALEMAEIALAEAKVVSPVDGVVADRLQSEGALVSPQTPIVNVISDDVELVLGVEESQIGQVQMGQKAEITVAAYPGVAFPAKVSVIAPSADPRSRTFQVKIRPDQNDGRLRQGMFAQVSIVTQEKAKAVLIPKEAVVTRSGQPSVFVLKDDIVQMRPVKLGLSRDGTVEVLNGVDVGEEVVVVGQNDLRDGDKVRKS